jgi:hypothetical protein
MRPVFIGGCVRSGKTLLGAMLGTHEECLCIPESQFILEIMQGADFDLQNVVFEEILSQIKSQPRFKIWEMSLNSDHWGSAEHTTRYVDVIDWVIQVYGRKTDKINSQVWVDHIPASTKHFKTLLSLYPQAKLIHTVRDGRAVAASLLKHKWLNAIDRVARFWLWQLAYGLAAESCYGEGRVMRVRYEDLIRSPTNILKPICDFIGIDYHSRMMQSDGFIVPAHDKKTHSLMGQKPDPSQINAWRTQLKPRQIEVFESIVGDMLPFLGYTPDYGIHPRSITDRERAVALLSGFYSVLNYLYRKLRLRWYADIKKKDQLEKLNTP